jgi:hypothetical protein
LIGLLIIKVLSIKTHDLGFYWLFGFVSSKPIYIRHAMITAMLSESRVPGKFYLFYLGINQQLIMIQHHVASCLEITEITNQVHKSKPDKNKTLLAAPLGALLSHSR